MTASSISKKPVSEMMIIQKTIDNLQTEHENYYLEDGSSYSGYYHIHKKDGQLMTGETHSKDSVNLYFKEYYNGTVIDKINKYSFENMSSTRYSRAKNKKI